MFGFLKRLWLFRHHRLAARGCGRGHARQRWRHAALASLACGACAAGVTAAERHRPPEAPEGPPLRDHAAAVLDGLLHEMGATEQQKTVARAARDEALSAMARAHAARHGDLDAALALFAAETIDEAAVAALRQGVAARHAAVEQVVVAGILKLHGQLDAGQRGILVAALADFRPEEHAGMGAAMGRRMLDGRIEQVLDRIHADGKQRAAVHAVKARIIAAFIAKRASRQQLFDDALALLGAAKIEQPALTALLQRHDADRRAMGDLVVDAARDLHAVLTPAQRRAVVQTIAERLAGWHRGG